MNSDKERLFLSHKEEIDIMRNNLRRKHNGVKRKLIIEKECNIEIYPCDYGYHKVTTWHWDNTIQVEYVPYAEDFKPWCKRIASKQRHPNRPKLPYRDKPHILQKTTEKNFVESKAA